MQLIRGQLISETKLQTQIVFNMNARENANIQINSGVLVESILEAPLPKLGKSFIHYVNPQTKEQWYEEYDRPLTQEEQLEVQNEKIDLLLMNQLEMEGIL